MSLLVLEGHGQAVTGSRQVARSDAYRRMAAAAWLAPCAACYSCVANWTTAGIGPTVDSADLELRVTDFLARASRPASAPREWLPARHLARAGPEALSLIRAVPSLEHFTVDAWSCAVGRNRHSLGDCIARELGASPSEVLWWYRLHVARVLRRRGRSRDEIARQIGYSDRRALRRALRQHGDSLE